MEFTAEKKTEYIILEVAGVIATNGIQDLDKTERGGMSQFGYVRTCLMSTAFKSAAHVPGFSMSYGDFCAAVLAAVEWELHPTKTSRHTAPAKTPGQIAYEEDCRRCPRHDDGSARPTWEGLSAVYVETTAQAIRGTWERNPTPRQWKTNNENHRGPAHRDYTGPDGLFPALT